MNEIFFITDNLKLARLNFYYQSVQLCHHKLQNHPHYTEMTTSQSLRDYVSFRTSQSHQLNCVTEFRRQNLWMTLMVKNSIKQL